MFDARNQIDPDKLSTTQLFVAHRKNFKSRILAKDVLLEKNC